MLGKLNRLIPLYRDIKRVEKKLDRLLEIIDPTGFYSNEERQVSAHLENIRADHRGRYLFACRYLSSGDRVLDMACGIGYGASIMADAADVKVTGVDISAQAIDFANRFYGRPKIEYTIANAIEFCCEEKFDVGVSFETVEHVIEDARLFHVFHSVLKKGGYFICSTPNQKVVPHSPTINKHHVRHYTVEDVESLLKTGGFELLEVYSQFDKDSEQVVVGDGGAFLIFVAKCI